MYEITEQFAALSAPELAAVLLAVAYLLLAIRENIWCWFCAALSTAIYVYLFAGARLYMESALNVFYFGMAVYGWWSWRAGPGASTELPVTTRSVRTHVVALTSIAALSLASGWLLQRFSDAAFPYIDSATTFAAIWATFLVARKVLENWWYWLVIDFASVFIYFSRDLQLTALLFVLYVLLVPIGLISWSRSMRRQALV